ncbi:hypothetical protein WJX72_003665 [[Myrmecia] bisecta]|uniref:ZNF380 coiled-coil domain-containing protein n=1 Tax=[Myrmecia] bisecta TaxID=41462 RepID=A0AAW1QQZ2_9CHLO
MAGRPDVKHLFKTARAQRDSAGPAKLTKEQIKALKAQKAAAAAQEAEAAAAKQAKAAQAAAAKQAAFTATASMISGESSAGPRSAVPFAPPPVPRWPGQTTSAKSVHSNLPGAPESEAAVTSSAPRAGFFESAASVSDEIDPGDMAEQLSRMAGPSSAEQPAGQPPALPQGFFEDKDADAKARGVPLPKKKDPKEEFQDFMKDISADIRQADELEAEEAAAAALDRAEREAFEQRMRLQRIEELRHKQSKPHAHANGDSQDGPNPQPPGASVSDGSRVGQKRKRAMDVLEPDADEEEDDEDDEINEDIMLDWRAKTL